MGIHTCPRAGVLISCTLAGSAVSVQAEDNLEMQVTSYLTGEDVPESVGRRRPIAVMLGNDTNGAPQSGTGNAGVIYEAPVEGGITRLMAVIEDYDNLQRIGSVRSCRDYYIFYASGFDAIYTHYGQSAYALPFLELPEVNNISGLAGYGDQVFYRTTDRKSPHNAYTSFEGIQKGIEINGYSQEYAEDFQPGYAFCGVDDEVELPGETEANVVKPGYFLNEPWFEYNPEDKLYYRFQYGTEQIDDQTNEQLRYKNLIVMFVQYTDLGDGLQNIDWDKTGTGYYITDGEYEAISWRKDNGVVKYYTADGKQLKMNPGKTFVTVFDETKQDKIIFE